MATFTGTAASETITPAFVSPTVATFGGSAPSDANDFIDAGGGRDQIDSSGGDDTVLGGGASDTASLGAGNDRFIWNRHTVSDFDGDDVIDGDAGADTVEVNASFSVDNLIITAEGARVILSRVKIGPPGFGFDGNPLLHLDIGTTENLVINAGDGPDSVSVRGALAGLIALTVNAGAGNDYLDGGDGDDVLTGGADNDTVVFTGRRGDYLVTALAGGGVRVADLRPGAPDGSDTVREVENFQFADGTFPAATVLNAAPTDITGGPLAIAENSPNGALVGTVTGQDPDGQPLAYALTDNGGGRFAIDNAGNITVANGVLLDFEQAPGTSSWRG